MPAGPRQAPSTASPLTAAAPAPAPRTLPRPCSHINKHNDFGDNTIATSKYTVVSFVPRSLLEQCVTQAAVAGGSESAF